MPPPTAWGGVGWGWVEARKEQPDVYSQSPRGAKVTFILASGKKPNYLVLRDQSRRGTKSLFEQTKKFTRPASLYSRSESF